MNDSKFWSADRCLDAQTLCSYSQAAAAAAAHTHWLIIFLKVSKLGGDGSKDWLQSVFFPFVLFVAIIVVLCYGFV